MFIYTYFLFRIYERDRRRLCGAGGHEAGHTAGDEEGDRQGQARDHWRWGHVTQLIAHSLHLHISGLSDIWISRYFFGHFFHFAHLSQLTAETSLFCLKFIDGKYFFSHTSRDVPEVKCCRGMKSPWTILKPTNTLGTQNTRNKWSYTLFRRRKTDLDG